MKLRFSWRYAVALYALTLLMGEAHEQAHIQIGRMICGCYGERDFSLWATCQECAAPYLAPIASLAGPLFTYAMIWLGAWLLATGGSARRRAIGISLIFAPLPFARIFTALVGGGDEVTFLRSLSAGAWSATTLRVVAAVAVLLACAPPIAIAWSKMAVRRRLLWIAALCLVPMLAQGAYVRLVLNRILAAGILETPVIAGTPALIVVHTVAIGLLFAFMWRWLDLIADEPSTPLD